MEGFSELKQTLLSESNWARIGLLILSILLLFIIGRIIRLIIKKAISKIAFIDKPVYKAFLGAISKSASYILISFGIVIGVSIIDIPENLADIIVTSSNILVVIAIGYFIYHLVEVPAIWFESLTDRTEHSLNKMFIPVIRKSLRVIVVVFIIIQIFQILSDKPITSILAGLGIGGLAVALAAQDTLKHFIGSFVIAGDKPFEIGDRVVIDGHDGPVESIGLRSTRIRTLEGHLISIPNGELANRTIRNIGKRPYIRRLTNITITYDTSNEKIKKAISIVKDLLKDHEGMDPDFPPRVYFNDFNPDSLNIIMIYWYHPADYWAYMEFSEKLNFSIKEQFTNEGIDFAFPTQTLHVEADLKRPIEVFTKSKKE